MEAANAVNNDPTQEAVNTVNEVIDRDNGYTPIAANPLLTTAISEAAFDAALIEERNHELCLEYDRWFDLVRKEILK